MKIQWNSMIKFMHGIIGQNSTVFLLIFEYLSILSGVIIIILIFEDLKCWEGVMEKQRINRTCVK